jgi:phosphopantothenoylcysteine decarboxylase / phosphopantothenate---cysteine ligase
LAGGHADNLLAAAVLVSRVPVLIAPAMHDPMWTHQATQNNVRACKSFGYRFIGPMRGPLASGDEGWGRMAEPAQIITELTAILSKSSKTRSRT